MPQDGSDKLMEMLAARQAPANGTFKPRVVENLTPEPVEVTSHREHARLMREAKCIDIGDTGQKEHVERGKDRSSMNAKARERRDRQLRTYTGRMPGKDES